jgi:deazaflavin-dependent oxidoreductase (nitroreductase family)
MKAIANENPVMDVEAPAPTLAPRWFVHTAWRVHRALYRPQTERRPLPLDDVEQAWLGAPRLTTVGRKSGQERSVIVGYLEDGPNLILVAMNGWDEGHPAWRLNLKAHPDAVVRLPGQGERAVRAREVAGDEREPLWQRWAAVQPDYDGFAGRRSTDTPVIVLQPVGDVA